MTTTISSELQSAEKEVSTKVTADLSWLKTHIVLLVLVVGLTWGSVYGVESLVSKHDAQAAKRQDAIAAQMEKSNAQIQVSTQQQIQQLAQANASLQSQVVSLSAKIQRRDTSVSVQQKTDASMQPSVLAQRWSTLINVQGEVNTSTDGAINVELPAAIKTVQQLESIPVLVADKADLQSEVSKQATIIINASTALNDSSKALSSEVQTHAADKKKADADLTSCKADARKGKTKWAVIAGIGGFILRMVLVK